MKALIAIAVLGAAALSAPAFAGSISVKYKDLDLSTAEGQKALDSRIESAARKVCGFNELTVGTRIPDKEARDCVAEAHRKLQKQIAMLTERDKQVVGS
ncbi:MAG: UrcA family protein [Novosphingobium sp.]|nr:UrcA family protein [Novosphingobium sp.]MBO9602369.1 UrcA family protein [Novosphingobium sp.]